MRDYESKKSRKKIEPDYGLQQLPEKAIENSPRIERLRKMLQIKERMRAYDLRGSGRAFRMPFVKKEKSIESKKSADLEPVMHDKHCSHHHIDVNEGQSLEAQNAQKDRKKTASDIV